MCPDNGKILDELLPRELWVIVFTFLRWDSWSSLLSLNLACRDFHHLVSPVLFRTIHVRFPHDARSPEMRNAFPFPPTPVAHLVGMFRRYREVTTMLSSLPEGTIGVGIFPYVRTLILSYGTSYDKHVHDELVNKLLENLSNINIIRWRGIYFPPRLFKILNDRPPAHFFFEGAPEKLVGHDLLMGAPYIRSLDITYTSTPIDHTDVNRELGKVILSLPNLERLILKHHASPYVRGRPVLLLPPGGTLPALRFLAFTNFDFDSKQAAAWAQYLRHRNLRHLSLDGTTGLSELIHALSSGCLSHLESLLIRVFDGLTLIKPWFVLILDRFLQGFIRLQACTLCDIPKEALHSVVRHQGGHLRQLRFVTSRMETFIRLGRAKMDGLLSPEEIEALSAELPLIETLGIDLVMAEKMPEDSLRAIARLSGLRSLELNVPARCSLRPVRNWTTWLNVSAAEEAFRYVDKMKHGVPLQQLDIQLAKMQPVLKFYSKGLPLDFWCIYSCWRVTETSNQVHLVRLPSKVGGLTRLTVQDLYEQTLDSAGLGHSEMAGFDPMIY